MPTQIRKTAQVVWMLLALGTFVVASSAQQAAGKKPAAKIQGESIDSAGAEVAAARPATNPPSTAPAKIAMAAEPGPGTASATNHGSPAGNPAVKGGYLVVDFERLASFDFDPPSSSATNHVGAADEADGEIPADIKALDKQKVMLRGFMMPVTMDGDNTTEFFITRNPMCCAFGMPVKLNELVTVKVGGKGLEPNMGQPVTIKGTLHVGTIRDSGDVTGLYRMDGEALVEE